MQDCPMETTENGVMFQPHADLESWMPKEGDHGLRTTTVVVFALGGGTPWGCRTLERSALVRGPTSARPRTDRHSPTSTNMPVDPAWARGWQCWTPHRNQPTNDNMHQHRGLLASGCRPAMLVRSAREPTDIHQYSPTSAETCRTHGSPMRGRIRFTTSAPHPIANRTRREHETMPSACGSRLVFRLPGGGNRFPRT